MDRNFNLFRFAGRLCFQVMLSNFERRSFAIEVLPRIAIGHNSRMIFAIGISWLWGDVNFGLMQSGFRKSEMERMARMRRDADKLGISWKQQCLRWKGY
jgi:hypothetical protein